MPTYRKLLNEYGIGFESNEYPEITQKWITENWCNTPLSMEKVAEKFNVPAGVIGNRASKFGIRKKFKYSINSEKLFNISDPNVCYLAGLLATDGYLNTNSSFVSIGFIGESERDLLHDIADYFESDCPVSEYNYKQYRSVRSGIRIACEGIREFFLKEFNIPKENKTFDVTVPDKFISEDCAKAYVLGCMDGDGCISHINRGGTVALTTASEKFVIGIKSIIEKYIDVSVTYRVEKRNSIPKYPSIGIGGRNNVLKFLDWMYSTTSSLKLERKYAKYLLVKDIV